MKRGWKILLTGFIVFCILAVCGGIWFQMTAPPGEEWIAYENDTVLASIDFQLEGINAEQIAEEKEPLILEKSVEELQREVEQGNLTYEELTVVCLYRIKTLDQSRHGYNSVVTVAPDAVLQARERDRIREEEKSSGKITAPSLLFGIPVMLKDNINTVDMPTSAGAVAFADFIPDADAELVRILREQGAVILGKNNMSEFAYFVSGKMPSGYSGRKGQTVNPFGPLKISPSGSSSGNAVAVTANLVPVSIGTETAGSIIGPSSVNSAAGFKPTRGSIPGEGIFPLIKAVDTPGPIAKSVKDIAAAYSVLSGEELPAEWDVNALKGKTVGLVYYEYNDEKDIHALRKALEAAGGRVIDVKLDQMGINVQNSIAFTFRKDFEDYAVQYKLPITKLSDLIAFNNKDAKRRIKYGQDQLEAANAVELPDSSHIEASVQTARTSLDELLKGQGLAAVVFLNTTASNAASAAGYPELTVPFGANEKGVPRGATFVAGQGEDLRLLQLGYAFEQTVRGRVIPGA